MLSEVRNFTKAPANSLSSSLIIHLRRSQHSTFFTTGLFVFFCSLNQLLAFHTYQNSLTLLVKLFFPSFIFFFFSSHQARETISAWWFFNSVFEINLVEKSVLNRVVKHHRVLINLVAAFPNLKMLCSPKKNAKTLYLKSLLMLFSPLLFHQNLFVVVKI